MHDEQQNIRNALLLGGELAWGPGNSPRTVRQPAEAVLRQ